MGFDIAICFINGRVELDAITRALPQTDTLYLSYWQESPTFPNIAHFTLWEKTEGSLNLIELCKEISRTASPIYIGWKSDHGGIGGYSIIEQGVLVEHIYSETNYVYLSIEGFQKVFGYRPIDEEDAYAFPELTFETPAGVYLVIERETGNTIHVSHDIMTQLIEGDIDAEPVLP